MISATFRLGVDLSPTEARLFDYLMARRGITLSRNEIIVGVWDDADVGNNAVDVYVHYLRRKFKGHPDDIRIETVRGEGYRLASAKVEA